MIEIPEYLQKLGIHVMTDEEYKEKSKLDSEFASEEELEAEKRNAK